MRSSRKLTLLRFGTLAAALILALQCGHGLVASVAIVGASCLAAVLLAVVPYVGLLFLPVLPLVGVTHDRSDATPDLDQPGDRAMLALGAAELLLVVLVVARKWAGSVG